LSDTFGITQFMKTIGYETTNFDGNFLSRAGDAVGYTILPVVTLTVISFAPTAASSAHRCSTP